LDGQNGVETVDKSSLMLLLIFIEMHFGGEMEVALEAPPSKRIALSVQCQIGMESSMNNASPHGVLWPQTKALDLLPRVREL